MRGKRNNGVRIAAIIAFLVAAGSTGSAAFAWSGYGQPVIGDRYDRYDHYDRYDDRPFSEDLYGYGDWEYVPSVGASLWFPHVDVTWRPYLHGHWIRTIHGMTWVAYEPWGFIPHHYGRWIIVDGYRWGWVPGYEYGPAWVTWGVADGYVGWAPVPPVWYHYAHRRTYRFHSPPVRYGFGGSFTYHASGLDFSLWIFVPSRHAWNADVYIHALPMGRSIEFFHHQRVLPVGHRLDIGYVREVTHRDIPTVRIHRKKYRLGNRTVTHYRPEGQQRRIGKARERISRTVKHTPSRSGKVRKSAPGEGQDRGRDAVRRPTRSGERKPAVRPKSGGTSKAPERKITKERSRSEKKITKKRSASVKKVTKEQSRSEKKITRERTRSEKQSPSKSRSSKKSAGSKRSGSSKRK